MTVRLVELGSLIRPAKPQRAGNRAFPILSMTMYRGLVDQADKFKKRVASTDTSQYRVVRRNQLVVGFPIDEGVLSFQRLYDDAIVSPAYDIWDLIDDADVDGRYLELYLRSPRALTFYATKLRGTTARRRTLPDDIFLSLPIVVPSVVEQRRIAAILDKAEELRLKRRLVLNSLDRFRQSLFLKLFGDPVSNPMKWPLLALGEVGSIVTGTTPSRVNEDFYGDAIEWIKSDNVNTPEYYVTQAKEGLSLAGRVAARVAPPNSILVTCIAGSPECIGNAAMTDREVAFNQQINAIIPNRANPHFVYAQIVAGKRLIQRAGTQSMKGMVSKSRFEKIRLPFPPTKLQEKFGDWAISIERLKQPHADSLTKLDQLFACLQYRAFQGEL